MTVTPHTNEPVMWVGIGLRPQQPIPPLFPLRSVQEKGSLQTWGTVSINIQTATNFYREWLVVLKESLSQVSRVVFSLIHDINMFILLCILPAINLLSIQKLFVNFSPRKLEREAGSIQPYSPVWFYWDREINREQCKIPLTLDKDLGKLQVTS